jgi:hypothetical protein
MANALLSVINCFSLVKAAMNAPSVCKLHTHCLTVINQCKMVIKTPQFLHFSANIFQVRNKFHSPYLNWLPTRRSNTLKGSQRMGTGGLF